MSRNDPGYSMANDERADAGGNNKIENVAKKGARRAAGAIAQLLKKAVMKVGAFLIRHPVILLVLLAVGVAVFVVIMLMKGVGDFVDVFTRTKETAYVPKIESTNKYAMENEFDEWTSEGDPDRTELLLEGINIANTGKDINNNDVSDEQKKLVADIVDPLTRSSYFGLSPADIQNVLKACSYNPNDNRGSNGDFFSTADVNYGVLNIWTEWLPTGGYIRHFDWDDSKRNVSTVDGQAYPDDNLYGTEDSSGIERERDAKDPVNLRFATHWQEVVALAQYYSNDHYSEWGEAEESQYDADAPKFLDETNTDGYYMTDEALGEIIDFFTYKRKYKYFPISDHFHNKADTFYRSKKMAEGKYSVGYRIHYVGDYFDATVYFTPDAAVDTFSNAFDTVTYQYTPTSGVASYNEMTNTLDCPSPSGDYCCGRWTVTDPNALLEGIREFCPHYYEAGQAGQEQYIYGWADATIQQFMEYLTALPATGADGNNRSAYYEELFDCYRKKFYRVSYEGWQTGEFNSKLQEIQAAHPGWTPIYPLRKNLVQSMDDLRAGVPSGWTMDLSLADMGSSSDYGHSTTNAGYPFHSYGVAFVGHPVGGVGGSIPSNGSTNTETSAYTGRATFSRSIYLVTAHVSGETHYYPDVERDNVYIDEATGERYGIVPIDDGALVPLLDHSDNMTIDQVRSMCQYLYELFDRPDLPFNSDATVQALYDWQESTGQPITGALALILTEGTYNKGSVNSVNEADHWNFWNYEPYGSEPWYTNPGSSRHWLDVKTLVNGDFPQALIHIMNKFYNNVWLGKTRGGIGQPTYYEMSFRGYGFPTTLEDAKATADDFNYCFCPWWGSPAFMKTGDEQYIYPNMNARDRRKLLEAAGIKTTNTIGEKLEACANWYIKHVPKYGTDTYDYLGTEDNPFGAVYVGGSQKVRADCSGFAAAFVSSLVDMEVYTTDSENSATESNSFGQALIAAGYSLHRIDEFDNADNFPIGSVLIQKKSENGGSGHVEIVVGSNGDGTLSTFGWGGKQSEYPSGSLSIYLKGDELATSYNRYRYVWLY